jgi:hypothetical protein
MQRKITIPGQVPSKKNSKRLITVHGRTIPISSKAHEEWHRVALAHILYGEKRHPVLEHVEFVHVTIYSKTKGRFDLSNKVEAVMDILVDAGVLLDDCWSVVPDLRVTYGGVDKNDPRAIVLLSF